MKLASLLVILFYIIVALASLVIIALNLPTYNPRPACGVIEIIPDATPEDRARCRFLRNHKL